MSSAFWNLRHAPNAIFVRVYNRRTRCTTTDSRVENAHVATFVSNSVDVFRRILFACRAQTLAIPNPSFPLIFPRKRAHLAAAFAIDNVQPLIRQKPVPLPSSSRCIFFFAAKKHVNSAFFPTSRLPFIRNPSFLQIPKRHGPVFLSARHRHYPGRVYAQPRNAVSVRQHFLQYFKIVRLPD